MTLAFYKYYPKLFHNYFHEINDKEINDLSNAGYLYYQSVLFLDDLIDDKDFSGLPKMMFYQEETIKILSSIYEIESDFWKYWNKRKKEYFEAVKIEKKSQIENSTDFFVYKDLADKKSTFGKVAIDSLFLLSDKKDFKLYEKLLKSHTYFSIAFQLYDDVKDFSKDFEQDQFNWAVQSLKQHIDFSLNNNDVIILNKLLYLKGIGQELLNESINYFQKSIDILNEINIKSEWLNVNIEMQSTIQSYLDTTNGYISTLEKKIEIKETKSNYPFLNYDKIDNQIIKKGLDFIKSDFENNFIDLKHFMYLSKLDGFENESQVHFSDTFQRALLNECLATVLSENILPHDQYFDNECDYLLDRINDDNIGAWSYYPTVKEISADIDDLGQIMQFFIKTGRLDLVDKYCSTPIKISINNRVLEKGGIETWILPKINLTKIQEKQNFFNETKWGKGPDIEVVANFIYALYQYNYSTYNDVINKSLKYLSMNQKENGSWESRWYYGNLYGTYTVIRILNLYKEKYSQIIDSTKKYLIDNQNLDGGYGFEEGKESDSLSTSFALLILKELKGETEILIKKSENYLILNQNKNGSWDAVDFIKPRVNDPYKSKTLTTAFVLKALC